MAGQRTLAVSRFEQFLAKYPTDPGSAHIRFRLADMYFEIAEEDFLSAQAAFDDRVAAAEESGDLEALGNVGDPPSKDYSKAIALYQSIIDDNHNVPAAERYERLDGVYLMLVYCLTEENSAQYDAARARAALADVIQVMPDSDLSDRAHMYLGNIMFEAENNPEGAIAEYQTVIRKGPTGRYYDEAIYQLAWSYYKLSKYDQALSTFTQLLDLSQKQKTDTGRASPFAKDARRFMAFSFADQRQGDALGAAKAWFQKVGPREYEWEVYRQLSDVLSRYDRPEETIAVYRALQEDPRWATREEPGGCVQPIEPCMNPEFQWETIKLHTTNFTVQDLARAGQERIDLANLYGDGSAWAVANQNNPEALERARRYIEDSLRYVAAEYHVRAEEGQGDQNFDLAIAKYREYLDKFPLSDDYYEEQWGLARALFQTEKYAEAEAELCTSTSRGRTTSTRTAWSTSSWTSGGRG